MPCLARALAAISSSCAALCCAAGKLGEFQLRQDVALGRFALGAGLPSCYRFATYAAAISISTPGRAAITCPCTPGGSGWLALHALSGWMILCAFAYLASRPTRRQALIAHGLGLLLCVMEMLERGSRDPRGAESVCLASGC